MDQIVGEREAEKTTIGEIKREYDITVQRQASDNCIAFSVQDDRASAMLKLVLRVAAMRRNPPVTSAGCLPCMADIERVETGLISAISAKEGERGGNLTKKLISGALEYQNRMRFPVCLVEGIRGHFDQGYCQGFRQNLQESLPKSDNVLSGEDFFRNFGFQYIYDRPHYALNTETISLEMLERAARGTTVMLDVPNVTLQAVAQKDMLSLAHFVNARLCRQYGFFVIRSAAYYEEVQKKLLDSGGNLFQIMENGMRKGYFICTDTAAGSIGEVVFDQTFDRECYLLTEKGKAPAVMARIVNMPEMLRHVAGNGNITIAIRLSDPVIAENDGLFLWYIGEEGSRMERVEDPGAEKANDSSMRPEVTTTIGAFTAFLFSYMKLKQNAKFDSIYLAGPAFVNEI